GRGRRAAKAGKVIVASADIWTRDLRPGRAGPMLDERAPSSSGGAVVTKVVPDRPHVVGGEAGDVVQEVLAAAGRADACRSAGPAGAVPVQRLALYEAGRVESTDRPYIVGRDRRQVA